MQSYPFTSRVTYDAQNLPQYDRAVDSAFLRKVFAQYFSDGVFYRPANALQVVAGTGMQVLVEPGVCHIQGAMGIEAQQRTLALPAAEAQPRIDTVVARMNLALDYRSIELYVVKGTAAAEPQAPALTRDTTIWELGLADILVAAGAVSIGQESITDTRLNPARCGSVAQTIGSLDTSPYFAQLDAALQTHAAAAKQQILLLQQVVDGIQQGSEVMLRAVYDQDGDGVVDAAIDQAARAAAAAALTAANTAQSTADSAATAAANAQGTANSAATAAATAQGTANSANTAAANANANANTKMPIAGGTFTGNVAAISYNRTDSCVRNIYVNGASTNYILMVRK